MLLGQGDFVTCLMDSVGPELKKRANVLYRYVHTLEKFLFEVLLFLCGAVALTVMKHSNCTHRLVQSGSISQIDIVQH
jgi:hypothetical protein